MSPPIARTLALATPAPGTPAPGTPAPATPLPGTPALGAPTLGATALRMVAACLAMALLSGCDGIDPYQRPAMWRPEGANAGNLAAMAQDPGDLIRGRAASGPEWSTGAAAVDRLWHDKAKPLHSSTDPTQGATPAVPPASGAQ